MGAPIPDTVACPNCRREWPWATEQAVIIDGSGACFGCLMVNADELARGRENIAGYRVGRCPDCTDDSPNPGDCPTCHGSLEARVPL